MDMTFGGDRRGYGSSRLVTAVRVGLAVTILATAMLAAERVEAAPHPPTSHLDEWVIAGTYTVTATWTATQVGETQGEEQYVTTFQTKLDDDTIEWAQTYSSNLSWVVSCLTYYDSTLTYEAVGAGQGVDEVGLDIPYDAYHVGVFGYEPQDVTTYHIDLLDDEDSYPYEWSWTYRGAANCPANTDGVGTKHAYNGYVEVLPLIFPYTAEELDAFPIGTRLDIAYTKLNDPPGLERTMEMVATKGRDVDCDQTIDSDGDGLSDCKEFDLGTDPGNPDTDGDGYLDGSDECPLLAAPGTGNGCPDDDSDGDGIPDGPDNCPTVPNGDQADLDGDGTGDACDDDIDGDGLSNDAEIAQGTNPRLPDTDGDGVPDGEDQCGTVPGDAATNGCPNVNRCDRPEVTARGFTSVHYDADLNLAAAPDPDFFDWDISARWCVDDNRVWFDGVTAEESVTVDPFLGTALELVGVTFRHNPDEGASFLIPVGGTTTGSIYASADYQVCVNPDLLFAGGGRLLETSGKWLAQRVFGQMPRADSAAIWLDEMTLRVDNSTLAIEERLLGQLRDGYTTKVAPFLSNSLFANSPLEAKLSGLLDDAVRQVGLALRGQDPTSSLTSVADSGFKSFLDVYGDGARIVIPRREMGDARQLWNGIVAEAGAQYAQLLVSLFDLEACGTVWQPIVTIYIPRAGDSFVDDVLVDRSVFDVKGGITTDTRP